MFNLKYCKRVPVKSTADQQLPDPSGPLSNPVPPLRQPKAIANVLKVRDGCQAMGPQIVYLW